MRTARYVVIWLLVGLWSHADAAVLCARKDQEGNASGTVVIRQECKKNEVQLDPVALGLKGEKGDPGPQGPQGDTGPEGPPGVPPPGSFQVVALAVNNDGFSLSASSTDNLPFQDITGMAVTFETVEEGCVNAQFAGAFSISAPLGAPYGEFRVLLDENEMGGGPVQLSGAVSAQAWNNDLFVFIQCGVLAGQHSITMEIRPWPGRSVAIGIRPLSLIVTVGNPS